MTELPTSPVYFLLVDDREENLVALEAVLQRENLHLLKARSGSEALEKLLEYDVALALVDVQMPSMDGFELAELMRGTQRTKRIPIIFLTAGSADEQRYFRGYEAGAVDFLHKPIEAAVLRSKSDVFFELYQQRQEVARQRDELQAILEENASLLRKSQEFAEALQDADRRKDEFLATLAHELRNPLAPILHAVQILRLGGVSPEELFELNEIVERQVKHMVRLIDDLLDVSRITRGKIQLRRERVWVADIVKSAVETSKTWITDASHRLEVKLPEQPIAVSGDAVRLSQVLANLLNNAAKYTPADGHIIITADRVDDHVRIRVEDNGVGIPLEAQGEIFDMFIQVKQHFQQARGGLGIGLTLVKRLVELHGGTASIFSEGEGQGTSVTIELPLDETTDTRESTADDGSQVVASPFRILVVDDNQDAARSLAKLLDLDGHDTVVANDGKSGIEVARTYQPDVVFLDLGMPNFDGFQTLAAMRALPDLGDVRIVAVTGWGQEADRQRTKEAGFRFHLVKPVEIADLRHVLLQIEATTSI
ncbi:response regulator [Bremerella alba]|uniref:histidine kinase n=1 Tax=Bremerella alba TaxID=980252 RepID=A0A7V9A6D7_9BACT|nr:response regulator [Bremerella alba]MBA2114152.1 Sensor histidine kinase RcsC [Bremerella alba]